MERHQSLPVSLATGCFDPWPKHVAFLTLTTQHHRLCIDRTGIQRVLAGGETSPSEGVMDGLRLLPLGFGGIRGHHRREKGRPFLVTGFGSHEPGIHTRPDPVDVHYARDDQKGNAR